MRTLAMVGILGMASLAMADTVSKPDCVRVQKQSSYRGYGYTHQITVSNGCDAPIQCTASSDSAPDPIRFRIAAGATADKTLKIGAPGSTFQLEMRCETL